MVICHIRLMVRGSVTLVTTEVTEATMWVPAMRQAMSCIY